MSPSHSSNRPEFNTSRIIEFLFGFAPSGVCPAFFVTKKAVCSYHTVSPLPLTAVYFLWHFPSDYSAQTLSGTLLCGARTFLTWKNQARLSVLPITPAIIQKAGDICKEN